MYCTSYEYIVIVLLWYNAVRARPSVNVECCNHSADGRHGSVATVGTFPLVLLVQGACADGITLFFRFDTLLISLNRCFKFHTKH